MRQIKADVGRKKIMVNNRETWLTTWAHREPTPDEIAARQRVQDMFREKAIARIMEGK